ncbi:MAG TPA: PhoH family protein [Actinomycetota bacterium]|nr:PhoH family protein [Actinomycetota bacterium]
MPHQLKILVPGGTHVVDLVGQGDELLRRIEGEFSSDILVRGNEITITGPQQDAERAATVFEELLGLLRQGHELTTEAVDRAVNMVKAGDGPRPTEVMGDTITVTRGRPIRPKTTGQKRYVDAVRSNTLVFSIGPAGTGKTYLAVAMAVRALKEKEISRIILTRPAVEAGERLGFLPGDIAQKVDPYLKPLYDALYDLLEPGHFARLAERGTIEVAPLAYMRGRTLNDSFIILDEAQNTTPEQMKMFLTRLGLRSKAVVTGDITQIDLPDGQLSGLVAVQDILRGIKGLEFVYLDASDVVRHKIVQEIVEAYRRFDEARAKTPRIG